MVKKSQRVKDAKGEREITFGEESLKNAQTHLNALTAILREVLAADGEYDYLDWLVFCESLGSLADQQTELSIKMKKLMDESIDKLAGENRERKETKPAA